jgi:hypothetical protein
VLIYNLYSSGATGVGANNTRINITNTNTTSGVAAHIYFIDGTTCSVADSYICLTPNQTASFLTSDIDPGVSGYIIAIATDADGLPVAFDYLIGDEYVKLDRGHSANLGAEAVGVSVLPLFVFPVPGSGGALVTLVFDGRCYNRLPRVLVADNIPARADGNDTLLILNRVSSNLTAGGETIGPLFGFIYDDAEATYSWTTNIAACQLRSSISNAFPRTAPRLENLIPAGRSGWMKLYATTTVDNGGTGGGVENRAITGAILNFNSNHDNQAAAFSGGHNLHILKLNDVTTIAVPVFPPNC